MSLLRSLLHRLSHQVKAGRARRSVHLSISVRTSSPGVEAAWAWSSSDGLSASGSGGDEHSTVVLEVQALADALERFSSRRVVVHSLTDPVAALGGGNPEMNGALERYRSHPRSLELFRHVELVSAQLRSLEYVSPGSSCSCDRSAAQVRSRTLLRASYPMPSHLPAQRAPLDDAVQVATDGSCDHVAGVGGWAWYVSEDEWDCGVLSGISSSALELEAVIAALSSLDVPAVEVISDCHAVVLGLNRIVSGLPVKADAVDHVQWERLSELLVGRQVTATWVRSHNGHSANTFADIKARSAMRAEVRRRSEELAAQDS